MNQLMSERFSHLIFSAHDLDLTQAIADLHRWGVILIRHVFASAAMVPLQQRAEQAFARRNQQLQENSLPTVYAKHQRLGWVSFLPLEEITPLEYSHLWLPELLQLSPITLLLQHYFGGDCQLFMPATVCREQDVSRPHLLVPYHQDGPFMKTDLPALNCWLPLNACGETIPGLEVWPKEDRFKLPTNSDLDATVPASGYKAVEIAESTVWAHHTTDSQWFPIMQAGDMLIFDHWCVHRTSWHSAMIGSRYSVEMRALAGCQAPIGYEALPFYPLPSMGLF